MQDCKCEISHAKTEQLNLSEENKRILERFKEDRLRIYQAETQFLRKLFWEKGMAALDLKDLKSENGFRFKETESIGFRKAESVEFSKKDFWEPRETAYFCPNGCGWVKGLPCGEHERRDINVRASIIYVCAICGQTIGRRRIK